MVHHLFQIVSLVAPSVFDRLLDRFPRADRQGMQTFAVDDDSLRTAAAEGGGETGLPETRGLLRAHTIDGLFRTGVWEMGPGVQTFKWDFDEFVHILEGETTVTAGGQTRTLRAGDVALFRAGLSMTWETPVYVRKVWCHRLRLRPLTRITRKAMRSRASAFPG
jgi:uncharacterized cupin superfamily protein